MTFFFIKKRMYGPVYLAPRKLMQSRAGAVPCLILAAV